MRPPQGAYGAGWIKTSTSAALLLASSREETDIVLDLEFVAANFDARPADTFSTRTVDPRRFQADSPASRQIQSRPQCDYATQTRPAAVFMVPPSGALAGAFPLAFRDLAGRPRRRKSRRSADQTAASTLSNRKLSHALLSAGFPAYRAASLLPSLCGTVPACGSATAFRPISSRARPVRIRIWRRPSTSLSAAPSATFP